MTLGGFVSDVFAIVGVVCPTCPIGKQVADSRYMRATFDKLADCRYIPSDQQDKSQGRGGREATEYLSSFRRMQAITPPSLLISDIGP